jgi:hypothetical protein
MSIWHKYFENTCNSYQAIMESAGHNFFKSIYNSVLTFLVQNIIFQKLWVPQNMQHTAILVSICIFGRHEFFCIVQSVQQLNTSWTVQKSNPGADEIFHTHPDWPCGPPSLLYNRDSVSFLGIKWPRLGVDHPPLTSINVKERVELYPYSPYGPPWPVTR